MILAPFILNHILCANYLSKVYYFTVIFSVIILLNFSLFNLAVLILNSDGPSQFQGMSSIFNFPRSYNTLRTFF